VEYTYTVGGKDFTSTSVRTRGTDSKHKSDVTAVLEKFPLGAGCTVFYNPDDPTMSYLEVGVDFVNYIIVISPIVFAFIFGAAFCASVSQRRTHSQPLTEAQHWGLAAGGILTMVNMEDFSTLRFSCGPDASQECLEQGWGINDPDELASMLEWLWEEGHSADCRTTCLSFRQGDFDEAADGSADFVSFLTSNLDQLEASALIGWDLSRLINVVRWGFTASYMTEEMAWMWIQRAAKRIQSSFASWEDFGADFLLGYDYWRFGTEATTDLKMKKFYEWLLENKDSPWTKLDWNSSLSEEFFQPLERSTINEKQSWLNRKQVWQEVDRRQEK
jgi:hypothetical protein